MVKIKYTKYFDSNDLEGDNNGIISYIVSKYSEYPKFIRNEKVSSNYWHDPRTTYLGKSQILYDVVNEYPFLTIDLFPFQVTPLYYTLRIVEKTTPPVKWDISGTNVDNPLEEDWIILSDEYKTDLCENQSEVISQCKNPKTNEFGISIPSGKNLKYRFIRYRVKKDRNHEYFSQTSSTLLRLEKFEIFGNMYSGDSFSNTCKSVRFEVTLLIVIFVIKN